MQGLLIAILALLIGVSNVSSQEASNHKPITQKQQKTEQKQAPPENIPVPVQETKSEVIKDTSKKPDNHPDERLDIDRQLAEYTRQLASFTLALVVVTAILAGIAIWQGIQMKATVSLAREEFNATHRPRIVVRRISPIEEGGAITGIQYTVHNVGDTECTITAISDQIWMPGAAKDLPAIPAYSPPREQSISLECNGSTAITHLDTESEFIGELNFLFGFAEESNPERVSIPRLLFLGYVNYIDRAGTKRQTAFLRQFNFTTKRFDPIIHPEYEYQD